MQGGRRRWIREHFRGAVSPAFVAVLALGLLSLGVILWSDGLWRRSFRSTVPLLDNLMQAKESQAEGYVWLEELLRGNRSVEVDLVADAYEQAVAALDDALEGRSAIPNLSGVVPSSSPLTGELRKYARLTRNARDIAAARWKMAQRGEAVDAPDLQLLSAFHALSLVAKATNGRLHDEIGGIIAVQTRLRDLTLTLWSCLLVGVSWGLFVAGRRRGLAEDALRRAHQELEWKVEERTAELVAVNERLRSEVDERRGAEEALGRSEQELRLLSSRLLAFHEDERANVARELHDGVAQALVAAMFRVDLSLRQGEKGGGDAASESGGAAVRLLQQTVDDVRRIYMGLRPSMLDELGLLAAAEWFCRQFREARPDIRLTCNWEVTESDVPEPLKIACYRIIQESLNNVARHSGAREAAVRLARNEVSLELTVEDDGIGFDLESVSANAQRQGGIGLGTMRRRTEASGGSFFVEGIAGGGTRVRALWPLPDRAAGGRQPDGVGTNE